MRASRVQRSMMPPSFTRSSATDWMKQLWTITLFERYWPLSVWISYTGSTPVAGEAIRAGPVQLAPLVLGDESDQIAESRPRLGVADENRVRDATVLSGIDPAVDAGVDPEIEQERLHAPREGAGRRRQADLRRPAVPRPQAHGPIRLEESRQVRRLGLPPGRADGRRDAQVGRVPEQAVLLDERAQALSVEPDPAHVEAGGFRVDVADVVVRVREDPLDPLEDEVELVLVDRHELEGEAPVRSVRILSDKAVALEPSHERRLGGRLVVRLRGHGGAGGQLQPHPRP